MKWFKEMTYSNKRDESNLDDTQMTNASANEVTAPGNVVKGGRRDDTYAYEEAGGHLFLRLKTARGEWGKRLVKADAVGTRLPAAIRRWITMEKAEPPPNWVYKQESGRIVPDDSDKIVVRKVTAAIAEKYGFPTKKRMMEYLSNSKNLGGKNITTYTGLIQAKKDRSARRKARKLAERTRERTMKAVLSEMQEKIRRQGDISRIKTVRRRKNNALDITSVVSSLNLDREIGDRDLPDVRYLLNHMLKDVIAREGFGPNDRVQVCLQSDTFYNRIIYTAFHLVSDVEGLIDEAYDDIEGVIQSVESISGVSVSTTCVRGTAGSGRTTNVITDNERIQKRLGLFVVDSTSHCGPTSLILCKPIFKLMNASKKIYVKERRSARHKVALELMRRCGIPEDKEVFDNYDFEHISRELGICVHIYELEKKVWISTSNKNAVPNDDDHHVYLLKQMNHFDAIYKPKVWFENNYICHVCEKGFDHGHKCKKTENQPKMSSPGISNSCSFCKKVKNGNYHRCCKNCLTDISTRGHEHKCFMSRGKIKVFDNVEKVPESATVIRVEEDGRIIADVRNLKVSDKYIFFDFEAMTHLNRQHKVNLVVIQLFDGAQHVFANEEEFVEFLLQKDDHDKFIFKDYTVIAHYGSGYDFRFIYEYIFTKTKILPFTIFSGEKITYMHLNKINMRFVDSYKFFLQPLEKLPKMFGLDELKKGYFPHTFNTPENQDYVGPIPEVSFYNPDGMKGDKRSDFLDWYDQQQDKVFNFRQELLDYCISDVDILRRACLELRKMFVETEGLDPFQYTTLPSATMALFRANHMPANTIAVFDHANDNQSNVAIEWLTYREAVDSHPIYTVLDGREAWITVERCGEEKPKKVDGFYDNDVYEFSGCYYHGCTKCFPERQQQYQKTLAQNEEITQAGYNLHHIWECEWEKMKGTDEVSAVLSRVGHKLPINPRDSFFGGRTETYKTFFDTSYGARTNSANGGGTTKARDNVKIYYKDVTSEYPWVNYTCAYPVGHPTVIKEDFDYSLKSYFGLVKCEVQPPRKLYHPVLPRRFRINKTEKLVFDLGGENNEPFTGTWTTVELIKALEKGYKINRIYEVHHFEEQTTDIFKTYIERFLKIKQESSGYPDWVKTEEDQNKYVDDYLTRQGIAMDKDSIAENLGLRAFAKLCLNNLWGRFGMRNFNNNRDIVRTRSDLFNILSNPKVIQSSVRLNLFDDVDHIIADYETSTLQSKFDTNVYVAVFTTSYARLKLYSALEVLGERVLYCDTDSVIYYHENETDHGLPEGDLLGEFTDELKGHHITQWASAGPKNYCYKLDSCGKKKCKTCCKSECKVKGFSLTHGNSQNINFHTMTDAIQQECLYGKSIGLEATSFRIRYDKKTRHMISKNEEKQWSYQVDKRKLDTVTESDYCYNTLPYGY